MTGKKGKTTPVDTMVGARVRLCRTLKGVTQEQLASHIGVTFQQIQKYEKGRDSIRSSRLLDFSRILEVPINYFFDDGILEESQLIAEKDGSSEDHKMDPLIKRDMSRLIYAFSRIRDGKIRTRFIDLVDALSEDEEVKENVQ